MAGGIPKKIWRILAPRIEQNSIEQKIVVFVLWYCDFDLRAKQNKKLISAYFGYKGNFP